MEKNKFRTFREAVLKVIKDLGGESDLQNIYDKIKGYWKFSPYQMEFDHKHGMERYKHNVCGTLQGLKREGLIENPVRGIWTITGKILSLNKRISVCAQKKISTKNEETLVVSIKNEIQ